MANANFLEIFVNEHWRESGKVESRKNNIILLHTIWCIAYVQKFSSGVRKWDTVETAEDPDGFQTS